MVLIFWSATGLELDGLLPRLALSVVIRQPSLPRSAAKTNVKIAQPWDVTHVLSFFLQGTASRSGKLWWLLLIGWNTCQSTRQRLIWAGAKVSADVALQTWELAAVCSFQSFAKTGQINPTEPFSSHLQLLSVPIKQRGADPDLLLLLWGCQFKVRHQRRNWNQSQYVFSPAERRRFKGDAHYSSAHLQPRRSDL